MEIREAQRLAWTNKLAKGFNTTDVPLEFCLLQSEVAEAFTAWRRGEHTLGEELADVALFLLALAEMNDVDLDTEIQRKMAKNAARKYELRNGVPAKVGIEMIREVHGDILKADAEALVNPVNTVGVMGAGLALQFQRAYPRMYLEYRADCQRGGVKTGRMHVHPLGNDMEIEFRRIKPCWIINFPTKQDWRKPSQRAWIERGLTDLALQIHLLGIRSIAIPPLGCGLGGLHWPDVRALIEQRLGDLDGVDVMLYVPEAGS